MSELKLTHVSKRNPDNQHHKTTFGWIEHRPQFYQTRSAWSKDQGSTKKRSAVHNFVPTNCGQESDFHLILDPWIKLILFDKSGARCHWNKNYCYSHLRDCTENGSLLWCKRCRYRWHQWLSLWQPDVPWATIKLVIWQPSVSVYVILCCYVSYSPTCLWSVADRFHRPGVER